MARWDPAHVTPKVKLCMHTKYRFVVPWVCLVKVPYLDFFGLTNTGRGAAI